MPKSKYEISVLIGLINKVTKPAREIFRSFKTMQKSMKETGRRFTSLGRTMTLGVTLPILGFAGAALKASGDLEMLRVSFDTLTGSTEKGGRLYKDIVNFAAKTPFQIKGLATATQTLLQYGIELENVIPTMRTIGDIALGDSTKFNLLSYAFGQIKGATILQGQELRQLINAGFNPLAEISINTGKSMRSLKSDMQKGLITFEMVDEAFKSATSKGGRFFEGMLKGSQTLKGLFSTLKDNIQLGLKDIGDAFVLAFDLKNVVRDLTKWIRIMARGFKEFAKNNPKMVKFLGILVMMLAIIGPLLATIGFLLIGLGSLGAVPIIAGILAVAAALGMVSDNAIKADGTVGGLLATLMSAGWSVLDDLDNQFAEWAKSSDSVFASIVRGFSYILNELPSQIEGWIDGVIGEIIDAFEALTDVVGVFDTIKNIFISGEGKTTGGNLIKTESETDINLKVKTDSGATVLVEGVKKRKGSSRVNISSKGTTGTTTPAGVLL